MVERGYYPCPQLGVQLWLLHFACSDGFDAATDDIECVDQTSDFVVQRANRLIDVSRVSDEGEECGRERKRDPACGRDGREYRDGIHAGTDETFCEQCSDAP